MSDEATILSAGLDGEVRAAYERMRVYQADERPGSQFATFDEAPPIIVGTVRSGILPIVAGRDDALELLAQERLDRRAAEDAAIVMAREVERLNGVIAARRQGRGEIPVRRVLFYAAVELHQSAMREFWRRFSR